MRSIWLHCFVFFILSFFLITIHGCRSSAVVSDKLIQKRKYNKGWFVSSSRRMNQLEKKTMAIHTYKGTIDRDGARVRIEQDGLSTLASLVDRERFENDLEMVRFHKDQITQEECDEILTQKGESIYAKVLEISPSEVKYKKCDFLSGPTYTIERNDVFMITYSNGSKDVFGLPEPGQDKVKETRQKESGEVNERGKKVHPLATTSIFMSVAAIGVAWLISAPLGLVMSILALVFGIVAVSVVSRNKEHYTQGQNVLSIFAIVLGAIGIAITSFFILLFV
jgi:hypothetical protein